MIVAYVEPSGESTALAAAEAVAAAEALGGGAPDPGVVGWDGLVPVRLPDPAAIVPLAGRLGLARRCLIPIRPEEPAVVAALAEGAGGRPASFRRVGRSEGSSDATVRTAGRAYRDGGGRIDLERPERRYWIASTGGGPNGLLLEAAVVDRRAQAARAMPRLPFQQPISLPTRYARAVANLARVGPGSRVVDPFLGTGALLAEAGLLGAHTFGIDRDSEMVRGALRNFAHVGVEPDEVIAGDAGDVEFSDPEATFDALLTDPPYGRASGTGGEEATAVWSRVVPRWAGRVVPGGRVVAVVPPSFGPLGPPWEPTVAVRVRVHRSLTREFRVYARPS